MKLIAGFSMLLMLLLGCKHQTKTELFAINQEIFTAVSKMQTKIQKDSKFNGSVSLDIPIQISKASMASIC